MNTIDEIRAALVTDLEVAHEAAAAVEIKIAVAEAKLNAHDRAVEAMRSEREPLSPANLGAATERAPRRNIPDEVYARLSGTPQTIETLAEAIGGTRPSQVQAAILKLGEKVRSLSCANGQPGYARTDMVPL